MKNIIPLRILLVMKCEKSLLFLFNIALSLECSKLDVDFDISALGIFLNNYLQHVNLFQLDRGRLLML